MDSSRAATGRRGCENPTLYVSRNQLKCVEDVKQAKTDGGIEHVTTDLRLYRGAFTPGIIGQQAEVQKEQAKGSWLYIERTEGKEEVLTVWVPEAASEAEERGDERVSDVCVVYAVVDVGVDLDKGPGKVLGCDSRSRSCRGQN